MKIKRWKLKMAELAERKDFCDWILLTTFLPGLIGVVFSVMILPSFAKQLIGLSVTISFIIMFVPIGFLLPLFLLYVESYLSSEYIIAKAKSILKENPNLEILATLIEEALQTSDTTKLKNWLGDYQTLKDDKCKLKRWQVDQENREGHENYYNALPEKIKEMSRKLGLKD